MPAPLGFREAKIQFYFQNCENIEFHMPNITWEDTYLWCPIQKFIKKKKSLKYLLFAKQQHILDAFSATCVTQFYTLQMTRCDSIFYPLSCKRERKCLQLKSVSSPIEMKTLSETDFFCLFTLENCFYICNWPKSYKHISLKCLLCYQPNFYK